MKSLLKRGFILILTITYLELLLVSCEKLEFRKPDIDTKITFQIFPLGEVKFINTTIGVDSVSWDFGDGTLSRESSPQKKYRDNGVYKIKFTAFKSKWQYVDSLNVKIDNIPKDTLFLYSGLLFEANWVVEKETNERFWFINRINHHKSEAQFEYEQPAFSINYGTYNDRDSLDIQFLNFESENIQLLSDERDRYGNYFYSSRSKSFYLIANKTSDKGFVINEDFSDFTTGGKLYKTIIYKVDKFVCNNLINSINAKNIHTLIRNSPVNKEKAKEINKKEYTSWSNGEKIIMGTYSSK